MQPVEAFIGLHTGAFQGEAAKFAPARPVGELAVARDIDQGERRVVPALQARQQVRHPVFVRHLEVPQQFLVTRHAHVRIWMLIEVGGDRSVGPARVLGEVLDESQWPEV